VSPCYRLNSGKKKKKKKIAPASGYPQTIAPSLGFTPVAGCWSSAGPLASRIPVVSVLRFSFRDYALLVSLFLHGSHILLLHSS
jgi:hypothetical protein